MVRQLEQAGIPTTHVTTLPSLALGVGSNRVLRGRAIRYPWGDPALPPHGEEVYRRQQLRRALDLLATPISEATAWE